MDSEPNENIKEIEECPECRGIGEISAQTCKFCEGTGKVIVHSHDHTHGDITHDHPHPHEHEHHPEQDVSHDHRHREDGSSEKAEKKSSRMDHQELCQKIVDLYPDIGRCGIDININFDEAHEKWIVNFKQGNRTKRTYLEAEDAELCLRGKQCMSLGIEMAQFVK